jgi:hypothetical protein
MSTGPQKYPGASTAYWYQDDYPGSVMESNVILWHSTEGTSLPSYDGGATAPNLTAKPDFAAQRLVWYQHFDIDTSSRALRNLPGGVETNTLNVCQIEIVGTCDPATHTAWGSTPHLYMPQLPGWAIRDLAAFARWAHEQHGVPLTSGLTFKPYPSSFGANGVRMTNAQWSDFTGHCGHQHAPENDHGDPGAFPMTAILNTAKDADMTIQKIDESNAFDVDLADDVWTTLAFTDAVLHSGPRQLVGPTYVHLTFEPGSTGLVTAGSSSPTQTAPASPGTATSASSPPARYRSSSTTTTSPPAKPSASRSRPAPATAPPRSSSTASRPATSPSDPSAKREPS